MFAGLAFAGLIVTLIMQRRELALQREELGLTRTELAGSKEQLAAQAKTLRTQAFENTFFEMVRLQHEIVNGTVIYHGGPGSVPITARLCFPHLFKLLHHEVRASTRDSESKKSAVYEFY